ncbi:MAG: hypothetical protein H6835_12375 [Planctomycetes bacterium]|nr:hypothetical protein [Planctomycetota bacterium]
MKRRTEHLVEKRDGRREFLRATKLARSIHLALFDTGVDEDWRALELAGTVLEGVRARRAAAAGGAEVVLSTTELADAVQHLLVVTGQPAAAVSYGAVQAERTRRRQAMAQQFGVATASPAAASPSLTLAARQAEESSRKDRARFGGRWPGEG